MLRNKTLYFLIFFIYCSVVKTQSVKDSLDLLIENETNDTVKATYIAEMFVNADLSTKKELQRYYEKGKKFNERFDNPKMNLRLTTVYARRLAIIGFKMEAIKFYNDVLSKAKRNNDSTYVANALLGLAAFDQEEGNIDKAKAKLNEVTLLLKNTPKDVNRIKSYNQLANIYRNEGNYDKAHDILDYIIEATKSDSSLVDLGSAFISKGRIYRFQGKNDSAKMVYKIAERCAKHSHHKESLAVIYNNLGNIEHVKGKFDEALEYYLKSLKIKEKLGDVRGTAIAYHNIGTILIDMLDWKKSLEYFQKSNLLAEEIKFQVLIVHNENKIGEVLTQDSLFDKAIIHHEKALKIGRKSGFKKGELTALYNLGNDYFLKNKLEKSNTYLIDGLKLAREIKSKPQESSILVKLAEVYLKSESTNQQQIKTESNSLSRKDIKQYLLEANRMADEMNNVKNKTLALEGLNKFYQKVNDNNARVKILQELVTLKDTLFKNDRIKAVANWETKYETAEREKEILQLESEKKVTELKNKQFKFIVLGSGIFLTGLLGFFAYWTKQKRKKLEASKRESFRAKLSSDLHDDVGSTLTGLAMQSELLSNFIDGNLKKSAENIALLSREAMTRMRDTVWAIDSRKDKLDDLIGRMQDFAQTNLLAKDISFMLDVQNIDKSIKIEPELRQNTYLIFKECIANVLKHSNATSVKSQLKIEGKNLILLISDNGKVNPALVNLSGVGLTSIKGRAKSINGDITISTQNGFSIELTAPH